MDHSQAAHAGQLLNRMAFTATRHCLTGCAIGEVLGMVIGTWLGWHDVGTIALAVVLAFVFGYSLTLFPLLKTGMALGAALSVTFAVDTVSIIVMEIVDNAMMIAIPGALHAGVSDAKFWLSLAVALSVAFVVTYPVNRRLIQKGRGHALVHDLHGGH